MLIRVTGTYFTGVYTRSQTNSESSFMRDVHMLKLRTSRDDSSHVLSASINNSIINIIPSHVPIPSERFAALKRTHYTSNKKAASESSFLTAHQHILGYLVPYNDANSQAVNQALLH